MSVRSRVGPVTFAQFLEIVREDQKADLIDGNIYMSSPENVEHNELAGWLFVLVRLYVQNRRLGRVSISRVAYRLDERTGPEPDIAFVRTERDSIIKRGYVDGPPDLAIEFVSPDSIDRDYHDKRAKYEEAGVQEYWIIDPDERSATFLSMGPDGTYVEKALRDGVFESRVLPGFRLDVSWLWQQPRPNELSILQSLLGR